MNEKRGCLPLLHKAPAEHLPQARIASALIPPLRPIVPTFRHRLTLGLLLTSAALAATAPAPALGASYELSGTSFPACAGGSWSTSGDTHTCSGSIALATGDTIIPSKENSVLVANAGITLAGNSQLGSNLQPLTVRTTWGSIQISGSGNTMYGDLESSSGAINISGSSHTGSITTNGAASIVASTVDGTVSAQNGIQTTNAEITGSLTATSGSISLSGGSVGGEVRSGCCSISANSSDLLGGATAHSGLAVSGGSIAGNFSLTALNAASFTNTTMSSGSISGASTITFDNSRIGIQAPISATAGTGEITVTNGSTVYGSLSAPHYSSVRVTSGSFVYGTCSPIKTDLGFCGEASCSPFLGQATINEVHQIGQNNWIEVKVFDSSTDYSGWTLRSCAASGNKTECGTYALAGIGVQNDHYIVVDVDKKHIDVHQSKSMSATLFDGSGKEIDFLNVNNFGVSAPNCPFVFDTAISTTSSNLKGVARLPDGDGQWEELSSPGNTDPGTIGDSNTPGAVFDHIRILHDGEGLTCAPETITVQACADADCQTPYTDGLSGQITGGNTAANFVIPVGAGSVNVPVRKTHPGPTTLAASSPSPSPASATRCLVGAVDDCTLTFSDAGFIVAATPAGAPATPPPQVAGRASSEHWLRAVIRDSETGTCSAALEGAQTVEFAYECINPASCHGADLMKVAETQAVTRNNAGDVSAYRPVSLSFDASGAAAFTFTYEDVGQIRLHTRATTAEGAALAGSTGTIVVRPDRFALTDAHCAGVTNPAAADAGGGKFCPAGMPFAVTVEARTASGGRAYSYGREGEGVKLTAARVAPDPGNDGVLSGNTIAGADFTSGSATATAVGWSEVGIITLTPSVADGDYLGAGDVTGQSSGNMGRFYPHHFKIEEIEGSAGLIDRADINTDDVKEECPSPFTYLDEEFKTRFRLIAMPKEGKDKEDATKNYKDGFAKFDLSDWGAYAFAASGLPTGLSLEAGSAAPADDWSAGVADITVHHKVSRPADDSLAPPAEAVSILAAPNDGEATTASGTPEALPRASTTLRFGRLRLANVYGYYSPLEMAMEAQYWSGKSWVLNQDDNCTVIEDENLAADQSGWNLTAPGTLAAGRGAIALTLEPGAARSARICVDLAGDPACTATTSANLPWLQGKWPPGTGHDNDPWATATFGIFRQEGRKGIYNRELY